MKRTFKKILCTLLVVVMCLTAAPLQGFVGFDWDWLDFSVKASALAKTGQYGDNISWLFDSTTGTLTLSGNGDMKNINSSSDSPFSNKSEIKKVIFENGIEAIGQFAFFYCSNLETIIMSDSVKSINAGAFHYCKKLTRIDFSKELKIIRDGAFEDCAALNQINIPDEVEYIGYKAFENTKYYNNQNNWENGVLYIGKHLYKANNNVTNCKVKAGTKTIVSWAFYNCEKLSDISIPDSVINIGSSILYNTAYYNDSSNWENGVLYVGNKLIAADTSIKTYDIKKGTLILAGDAFQTCKELTSVTIPEGVTIIGNNAFYYCINLNNIVIPNSVVSIGRCAFYDCKKLKHIYIGKNISYIDEMAFNYCDNLSDVYFSGTEEQWNNIDIDSSNIGLKKATIHYNCKLPQDSYFMVSSDTYSVDSIHRKETATYKINLLDANSDFLPVDDVTVQNNTTDIVAISTKKVSDTELELTVEPIKDGDASISLFNGDGSVEQFFNFIVYSNTTTYRADQVPVTNEKLKTNFSRGDMTVDNFEYYFDENKGKYIATMDVYNSSGAIGVVAAYTQDGKISEIEQVDPYIPLPGDFGEFLVYLGSGAVGILKGENWNYRFAGDSQKTSIEIEVPEDGYLTVSCDVTADNAAFIYNLVSIGVDFAFKTAEVIDVLGTDTDKLAKDTTKTLAKKVSEYFNEDSEWTAGAIKKLAKKLSKNFNMAYLEDISVLSLEMLDEMYKNVGEDFSDAVLDVIIDLTKEEIKEFGVMVAAKKLIKDKVIGTAEKTLLKAASIMFDGGSYINLLNSILGAYRYNVGTGKTMVVFKPKGEDGFICKDTIKVTSDIITDEVLLHTYIIKDTQKEDAFVRKTIYSDFNRGDGLRKEELSIDLNRIIEIHEISLWKNGQEVFDTFTATVEMNLPSYIDRRTCSIYRVEKDGTYTKLDTRIEGNKIIFETNHFSEYILTGVIEDLQETTPCDVHIYEEVRYEPSCTEEGSITYTCYCGDTYTETIGANGHTYSEWIVDKDSTCSAEGSKHIECTVCEEVLNTEAIAKLPHNYSSVIKEATCETGGYTTYTCTCGDTYTGDKTPAKGHDYAEGVCTTCGDSKLDDCSCNCHKTGLSGIIWKIFRFFYKLFKINPVCDCGLKHY